MTATYPTDTVPTVFTQPAPDPRQVDHPEPRDFLTTLNDRPGKGLSQAERAQARQKIKRVVRLPVADFDVKYRRLDIARLVKSGHAPSAMQQAMHEALSASDGSKVRRLSKIDETIMNHLNENETLEFEEELSRRYCHAGATECRYVGPDAGPDEPWEPVSPELIDSLDMDDIKVLATAIAGSELEAIKSARAVADAGQSVAAV